MTGTLRPATRKIARFRTPAIAGCGRNYETLTSLLGLILCSVLAFAVKPTRITVAISPATATAYSGATKQLTATVRDTINTAVTWSTTAGTVTSGGLYTAPVVAATTTTYVTATSVADTTKKATAAITVNRLPPTLRQIALSPSSASLNVGSTQQFMATAYDQYGHTSWGTASTKSTPTQVPRTPLAYPARSSKEW